MAKHSTGARYQLGEPLAGDLVDFCEAHYGTSEIEMIRRAVRVFIDSELKTDSAARTRFDAARKKRLSESRPNVRVLRPDNGRD
jgi:hypothetical protein